MSAEKYDEIKSFLIAVKTTLQRSTDSGPTLTFSTVREKNMNTLAKLEMETSDVSEVIMLLTPDDYCEGPLKDSKIIGDLWIFGKVVKKREVYIKLKLSGDVRGHCVRIISFHFPDKPMKYFLDRK